VPRVPVPADVEAFLRQPNAAIVASLRSDGSPHTVATWYDWRDDRVLLNMDESRLRLRFMRRDPRVALTVVDEADWGRHVSLLGEIVSIEEDAELRDIDSLAVRYTGQSFRRRDRRRFSAWMRVDSWHGWDGPGPWPGSEAT
jgi:PPOX class probable F420-dependent enzyme